MNKDFVLSHLPEEPRDGMVEEALSGFLDADLGGNLLLYERQIWFADMDNGGIGWPDLEPQIRPRWAAHCTCTACRDDFWMGWVSGGRVGAILREDGELYEGVPDKHDYDMGHVIQYSEGDKIACPNCGAELTLKIKSALRNGRTHQIMVGSIENIGPYTALLSWIVCRCFDWRGRTEISVYPCYASVIDDDGCLRTFSHVNRGYGGRVCAGEHWSYMQSDPDPFQARYYSYEAFNHTKVGGWMWEDVPEQLGQTGEKTGLADYVKDHGNLAILYLRFWRKHRNIENLVKAGWTYTIDSVISNQLSMKQACNQKLLIPDDLASSFNFDSTKPTDMLFMTKEEIRQGRKWRWDVRMLMLWRGFVEYRFVGRGDATQIRDYVRIYGLNGMEVFFDYISDGWEWSLPEFDSYLGKQERRFELARKDGLQMLIDYREALNEMVDQPTDIELWPVNLRAAHDRMTGALRARNAERAKSGKNEITGFSEILETWGALEWSDGAICARLPRMNQDLIDEGHTLDHCVGGYGNSHVGGKLVVFIRHARRPERSWFTLNIDTTGSQWREIQLHGYKNEFAHGKKLKIPKAVRDFCDRWEKEVLEPVFRQVKAAEAIKQERPNKKRRGAA